MLAHARSGLMEHVMRNLVTIAVAAGLVLTAAIAGIWVTNLSAGNPHRATSVDPHEIAVKAKDLPVQPIENLY
jgi:hypothetical protein